MSNAHNIAPYGILRIHLRASDSGHHHGSWWKRLLHGGGAFRQIVRWAHEAGLPMAMVHRSHLGFVNHGPITNDFAGESPNPHALVVIELGATEADLRAFVERHHLALRRAHVTYQPLENWSIKQQHSRHHAPHAAHRVLDRQQIEEKG